MTDTIKMSQNKNTAGISGILLLLNFAIGVYINLFILGPLTFGDDYLTQIYQHQHQLITAVLLYLVSEALFVAIAIILSPVFKQVSHRLNLALICFCIISFTIVCLDNLCILALLSVSKEYTKAVLPVTDYLKAFGSVLYHVRMWAHLLVILVGCVSLFIFYYLFFLSNKIPQLISIGGLLGVLLMFAGVLIDIFGQGLYMLLFLPVAIIQIVVSLWLMVKGFGKSAIISDL